MRLLSSSIQTSTAAFKMLPALLQPLVFLVCLLPLARGYHQVTQNALGANPVEAILHLSGGWALKFLMFTLCVTPLQKLFKWVFIARLRRMLGLFAFFYAVLHLSIWVALEQGMDFSAAVREIFDKRYITIGIVVVLGMLPLALTSNRFAVRKLGRRWKPLHQLIYPLSVLAIVHFLWQVRGDDIVEPAMYLGFLCLLLAWRVWRILK